MRRIAEGQPLSAATTHQGAGEAHERERVADARVDGLRARRVALRLEVLRVPRVELAVRLGG